MNLLSQNLVTHQRGLLEPTDSLASQETLSQARKKRGRAGEKEKGNYETIKENHDYI